MAKLMQDYCNANTVSKSKRVKRSLITCGKTKQIQDTEQYAWNVAIHLAAVQIAVDVKYVATQVVISLRTVPRLYGNLHKTCGGCTRAVLQKCNNGNVPSAVEVNCINAMCVK